MALQPTHASVPQKDSRQIKLLNECWYFYRNKPANGTQRNLENEI